MTLNGAPLPFQMKVHSLLNDSIHSTSNSATPDQSPRGLSEVILSLEPASDNPATAELRTQLDMASSRPRASTVC